MARVCVYNFWGFIYNGLILLCLIWDLWSWGTVVQVSVWLGLSKASQLAQRRQIDKVGDLIEKR